MFLCIFRTVSFAIIRNTREKSDPWFQPCACNPQRLQNCNSQSAPAHPSPAIQHFAIYCIHKILTNRTLWLHDSDQTETLSVFDLFFINFGWQFYILIYHLYTINMMNKSLHTETDNTQISFEYIRQQSVNWSGYNRCCIMSVSPNQSGYTDLFFYSIGEKQASAYIQCTKEAASMKQPTPVVHCIFTETDLPSLLEQSFRLYLHRILSSTSQS